MAFWRKNEPSKTYPGAVGSLATRISAIAEQLGLTHWMEITEARTEGGRLAWSLELVIVAPDDREAKRIKQIR